MSQLPRVTTTDGAPATDVQTLQEAGVPGPILFQDGNVSEMPLAIRTFHLFGDLSSRRP